jgi:hypothetical protein
VVSFLRPLQRLYFTSIVLMAFLNASMAFRVDSCGAEMCQAGVATDSPCWRPATERGIGELEPSDPAVGFPIRNGRSYVAGSALCTSLSRRG